MNNDREAHAVLTASGIKIVKGVIQSPQRETTTQEREAIYYLCDEWDYDYQGDFLTLIHISPSEPRPGTTDGHCPEHPTAQSEPGFGLAGGGFGSYQICVECGRIFGKQILEDDES